jgi:hypothetical protein
MIIRTQMNPENEKVAKSMQNVYFKLIRIKYAKKYTFKLCVSLLQTKQKHNAHRICKEYIYLLRLRQLEFKTTDR